MQTVDGTLLEFVAAQQRRHDAKSCPTERKGKGHFGTPAEIAAFMAGMFPKLPVGTIRILDPGAGVGTLSAALCDRIARLKQPRTVSVEVWENDTGLLPYLHQTMNECQEVLESRGHEFSFTIRTDDFILAHADRPLFGKPRSDRFDLVITNPPYFKLRKETEHAQVMLHVVHGQPNIYALFLAVSVDLLRDGGHLVAITPRSYFSGPYFHRFRRWFFDRVSPRQIHLFESRTAAFRDDAVLQENVILSAEKCEDRSDVSVTASDGRDLSPTGLKRRTLSFSQVIDDPKGDCIVRVSGNDFDQQIVDAIDRLPMRFRDSGLEVSTGPVVHFRAAEFLLQENLGSEQSAPLLWMHNVRPFKTTFTATHNGKARHIKVCEKSRSILLRSKRYVLLKRFTAKEEKRRLVAGIMDPDDSYSPFVGLDNKLNYIHKPLGELTANEAFGLAAFLNSVSLDRYIRAVSGNTQVNAAEVRMLPMPDLQTIAQVGDAIRRMKEPEPTAIEEIVGQSIGLDSSMVRYLSGLA